MTEYRLPFLEEDVAALYERIKVPHPIRLNVRENPSLAAVVNDLQVPGSAFFFEVDSQTPITASREGVVYTVRRDGLHSDAHATNLMVIEHEDGSAVRIEHLDPVYEKGDVVNAGDILGLPKGYLGAPHIHWYSLTSPDCYFSNKRIVFSNVPRGKVNSEYQSHSQLTDALFAMIASHGRNIQMKKIPRHAIEVENDWLKANTPNVPPHPDLDFLEFDPPSEEQIAAAIDSLERSFGPSLDKLRYSKIKKSKP